MGKIGVERGVDDAAVLQQGVDDEQGEDCFIAQVEAGQIKGLQFYDDPGRLLLDNLRFVTEYIKR